MSLFQIGQFTLHSGQETYWLIDCSSLSNRDIEALAEMIARIGPFSRVEGVPRGGLRLASALQRYVTAGGPLLIVDDVLTTGASLEQHRAGRAAVGVVIFARGPCPKWVLPLFVATDVLGMHRF